MKLFGKRPAEPARPALVRAMSSWNTGEWPRSYEAQVRDAYLGNPIAQRSVRIVAEGAAGIEIYANDDAHKPAQALIRQHALVETVATHLLLQGNAFIQIVGDADGTPSALYALRPERVVIEPDALGWPRAFLYRAGETATRYPVRDELGRTGIVHLKAVNPIDDHYGAGSLGPAGAAVAVHNAAARWNKALLDNAARPSGALVYEPGEAGGALSADQFERLPDLRGGRRRGARARRVDRRRADERRAARRGRPRSRGLRRERG